MNLIRALRLLNSRIPGQRKVGEWQAAQLYRGEIMCKRLMPSGDYEWRKASHEEELELGDFQTLSF